MKHVLFLFILVLTRTATCSNPVSYYQTREELQEFSADYNHKTECVKPQAQKAPHSTADLKNPNPTGLKKSTRTK